MGRIDNQRISDFYREATSRGFARDFQFRLTSFVVNGQELSDSDMVFLKTASLPSKTISTIPAPFMGLDFQVPGTVKFDGNAGWPVKFYCTQDYGIREFLEQATLGTFDQETSTGDMEPRGLYTDFIKMSLIDDQMNEIRSYTLLGAFITKIDEIGFDLTKGGGIQEVGASIAYQYWTTCPSSDIGFGIHIGVDFNIPIPGTISGLLNGNGSGLASRGSLNLLKNIPPFG